MITYPIPMNVMQALVNYLQTKPWQEVNDLMLELKKIVDKAEAEAQAQVEARQKMMAMSVNGGARTDANPYQEGSQQ